MSEVLEPGPASPLYDPVRAEVLPKTPAAPCERSALAPLREPLFRSLWIAAVVSYTGSWMQNIATGWLMTSLTHSPMWVAMVQVALSLPVFLIALPAGALADMVDRRKFLLLTQVSMVAACAALGVLAMTGTCTPRLLLVFTFLLGLGAVMNDPAWQAVTPDLVPAEMLPAAVALNSAGFNIARAAGPALGGLVIATAGPSPAFLLNALSFSGVILFLYYWKAAPREPGQTVSTFSGAVTVGMRYARQESRIRAVLARTLAFSLCASAFWALLPLIASRFGAQGYGVVLACFGLGALGGAGVLALARRSLSHDGVVACATLVFAGASIGLVHTDTLAASSLFAAAAGVAWICVLATLNLVAQMACAAWVRARVISMYVLVLQGGLALGSALWGTIASRDGVRFAVTTAAIALAAGLLLAPWYRLQHPAIFES